MKFSEKGMKNGLLDRQFLLHCSAFDYYVKDRSVNAAIKAGITIIVVQRIIEEQEQRSVCNTKGRSMFAISGNSERV